MAQQENSRASDVEYGLETEKEKVQHHEVTLTQAGDVEDPDDAEMSRRVTRKIDFHLLPLLMMIYTVTFLDRVNIGNARIWDMEEDLGMTGLEFNVVVLGKARRNLL